MTENNRYAAHNHNSNALKNDLTPKQRISLKQTNDHSSFYPLLSFLSLSLSLSPLLLLSSALSLSLSLSRSISLSLSLYLNFYSLSLSLSLSLRIYLCDLTFLCCSVFTVTFFFLHPCIFHVAVPL